MCGLPLSTFPSNGISFSSRYAGGSGADYPKAGRLRRVIAGPHSILDEAELHVRRVGEDGGDAGGGGPRAADHDACAAHVDEPRRVGAVACCGLGDGTGRLLDEAPRDPLLQPVLSLAAVALRPTASRVVQPAAGSRRPFGGFVVQCRGDGERLRVELMQAQYWPAGVSRPRNRLAAAQVSALPCSSRHVAGGRSAAGCPVAGAVAGAPASKPQPKARPVRGCVHDPATPVDVAAAGRSARDCGQKKDAATQLTHRSLPTDPPFSGKEEFKGFEDFLQKACQPPYQSARCAKGEPAARRVVSLSRRSSAAAPSRTKICCHAAS